MSKIKCITFDKEAQYKIPKDIRKKMNRDREMAQNKMNIEKCQCCNGTGICEDIDNEKGACMTCNEKGYFTYLKRK